MIEPAIVYYFLNTISEICVTAWKNNPLALASGEEKRTHSYAEPHLPTGRQGGRQNNKIKKTKLKIKTLYLFAVPLLDITYPTVNYVYRD